MIFTQLKTFYEVQIGQAFVVEDNPSSVYRKIEPYKDRQGNECNAELIAPGKSDCLHFYPRIVVRTQ